MFERAPNFILAICCNMSVPFALAIFALYMLDSQYAMQFGSYHVYQQPRSIVSSILDLSMLMDVIDILQRLRLVTVRFHQHVLSINIVARSTLPLAILAAELHVY